MINEQPCENAEDFSVLDEIAMVLKARGQELGEEDKDVSVLFSKLLKVSKLADKIHFHAFASVLTTILYAFEMGPEAISCIDDILDVHFWEETCGCSSELEEGMLNLFNEDGSRVSINSVMKVDPVQMSFNF
jgi:hypothetical protein